MRVLILLVLAATALSLAACGRSDKPPASVAVEERAESAPKAAQPEAAPRDTASESEQEQDESKIRHIGDSTVNENVGQPLPATFPAEVYVPSRYTVLKAMDMGGVMFLVSLEVPGTPEEEFEQARQAMVARGWKETDRVEDGRSRIIHLEDGKHRIQYWVFPHKSSGKTQFEIDYLPLPGAR